MKNEHKILLNKILKILIAVVIVLGTVFGVYKFINFKINIDGQLALGEARIIRIVLKQEEADMYASNATLSDPTTDTGFKDSVIQSIKKIHDFDGVLHLLKCSKDGKTVLQMTYATGNYLVEYDAERADGNVWRVYFRWHMNKLL